MRRMWLALLSAGLVLASGPAQASAAAPPIAPSADIEAARTGPQLPVGASVSDSSGRVVGYIKSIDNGRVLIVMGTRQFSVPVSALNNHRRFLKLSIPFEAINGALAARPGGQQ